MNLKRLFFIAAFMTAAFLKAQTYTITHFYLTKGGQPYSMNGRLEITDSTYTTFGYNGKDTTINANKILKVDGNKYYLADGYICILTLSTNKSEKKEGVYYIDTTKDLNDPAKNSLSFRVVRKE